MRHADDAAHILLNMDKCEEGRERAFKYVVLFAGLISLISIVSLSVTIPMAFSYVGRLDRRMQLDTAYCEETVSEITDEIVQFSYAASLIGNTTTEPSERGKRYADPYRSYFPTESPFPSGMDVQGSCCIPGPPGPPGLPGANGRPGIPGIPGEHGQPGRPPAAQCDIQAALSCPVCPAGPRGEPGRKGASGDRGPQGIPGKPGRPGPNGVPGSKGLRGIPGLRGQDGAEGDPGIEPPASVNIPCERGPLGEPGPPGPPGYSGEDGLDAPPGPAGRKGRPGYRGQPGIPGAVGPPGAPGAPGKAGGPGVCPTYCAIDGGSFYPDESVKINFKEA